MQLFFLPVISGKKFALPEKEAKHCTKVLRLNVNDTIWITCGDGRLFEAEITRISAREVIVEIRKEQKEFEKRNYYLHIAIAPTKNIDRFEWFIEKATEIGVDEITPIITHHSERRNLRKDRIEKVIIAAMKQSLKAYKPQLNPLKKFDQFLDNFIFTGEKYMATCLDKPREGFNQLYNPGDDVLILIGPEGDFSEEEIKQAIEKGFRRISLGKSRLRTETAGVTACYAMNILNQDF